ncbi:MAG: hypothetical protein ACRCWR_11120 [Saezia sp.]
MIKISENCFFDKVIYPIGWFGLIFFMCAVFLSILISKKSARGDEIAFFLFMFFMFIGLGISYYFKLKSFVWSLVDEVYDCGDHLLVRHKGIEERIWLCDIIDVKRSHFNSLTRMTLSIKKPGVFGDKIHFSPEWVFPFLIFRTLSPEVKDLIKRIDQAKLSAGQSAFN